MSKIKRILAHPLLIAIMFCAIIVSGEQMGGIYLLYITLGLPHFALHSLLGLLGIITLLYNFYFRQSASPILNVAGALLMLGSLLYFFLQPGGSYNYHTFYETLPLLTLILFAVLIIVFLSFNIRAFFEVNNKV